jgi:Flp pilus assembly protein TadG
MKKLDDRGAASWEFILVAVPFFTLVFAIFDLGRFAITLQSLQTLADAGARAVMICYANNIGTSYSGTYTGCDSGNPMTTAAMKNAAPFLYYGGLTPTLGVTSTGTAGSGKKTVTASQPAFAMMTSLWGTTFNAPSATASIPF